MRFPLAAALSSVLLFTSIARADPILYGGNGGHPNIDGTPLSIHNGWLVGIDQDTGTVVPIGHPDDVASEIPQYAQIGRVVRRMPMAHVDRGHALRHAHGDAPML